MRPSSVRICQDNVFNIRNVYTSSVTQKIPLYVSNLPIIINKHNINSIPCFEMHFAFGPNCYLWYQFLSKKSKLRKKLLKRFKLMVGYTYFDIKAHHVWYTEKEKQ